MKWNLTQVVWATLIILNLSVLSDDFRVVTLLPKPGASAATHSKLSKLIESNQPKLSLEPVLTYMRTASSGSFIKSTNIYQTICQVIEFWKDPPEVSHAVKSLSHLKGKKNHNNIFKLPTSVLLYCFWTIWSLFILGPNYPSACLWLCFLISAVTGAHHDALQLLSLTAFLQIAASRKPETRANQWWKAYGLPDATLLQEQHTSNDFDPKVALDIDKENVNVIMWNRRKIYVERDGHLRRQRTEVK